jgi:hypothetical protein
MRACFMGPTVFALGYGVAIMQSPAVEVEFALEQESAPAGQPPEEIVPTDFTSVRNLIVQRGRLPVLG